MRGLPVRFGVEARRKGPRFPGLRGRRLNAAWSTEKTPDSMAVQGVFREPVSHTRVAISLLNRENTGNFLESGHFRRDWS